MARTASPDEHGLPSLSLVFGYIAVKELQFPDRVKVLARLGYGNAEIAKICESTPASVATIKYAAKKNKKRTKKKKGKKG